MKTVLFLCSGNYYRSRFAEEYFNYLATEQECAWRATSRGLVADRPNGNVGPMSPLAQAALRAQGIATPADPRAPQQVTAEELAAASLVIALKEAEHRPMLARRFPEFEDAVVYWTVHDLDVATADQVLPALAGAVAELLAQLCRADQGVNKDLTPAKHLLNNIAGQ